jgi:hypothetical protein
MEISIEHERILAELPCSSYSKDYRQAGKSSGPQNLTALSTLLEQNIEALWRINSHFLPGGVGAYLWGGGVKSVLWVTVGLGGPLVRPGGHVSWPHQLSHLRSSSY